MAQKNTQMTSCLVFKNLPSNMELLKVAFNNKHSSANLEDQFSFLHKHVKKIYDALGIPILTQNAVRHRYMQMLKIHWNDKRKPNLQYGKIMLNLFHVAKCNCYNNIDADECKCKDANRIPSSVLPIYLDQMGSREWSFKCDCAKNHHLMVINDATGIYLDSSDSYYSNSKALSGLEQILVSYCILFLEYVFFL